MSSAQALLKRAVKLVPTHGFTRETLALSTVSDGKESRLSQTAISALFGPGDEATKTLIRAWMEQGREDMKCVASHSDKVPDMQDVLLRRLRWNESTLPHLKDVSTTRMFMSIRSFADVIYVYKAFALMSTSPASNIIPLLDFRPAFTHAFAIANDACYLVPSPPNSIPVRCSCHSERLSCSCF